MRMIDADRLNRVVNETLERLKTMPLFSLQQVHLKTAFQTLTDMINNAPTIDAVPVVRCKDCRWGKEAYGNIECFADMNVPSEYHGYEWFCPSGERKETDE